MATRRVAGGLPIHPPCLVVAAIHRAACLPVRLPVRLSTCQPASQPASPPACLPPCTVDHRRFDAQRIAGVPTMPRAERRAAACPHLTTCLPPALAVTAVPTDCLAFRLPAVPPCRLPACLSACLPACLPAHRLTAPSANRRRAFHASCRVAHRRVPWPAPAAAVCLAPAVPPCRPLCRSPCRPPRRVRRPEAASNGAAPTVAASRAAYRRSAFRAAERRRLPPACAVPMLPRRRRRAADRRRPAWCLAVPPACPPAYRLARRIAGALDARRIAGVPTMPAAQRVAACLGP